MLKKCGNLKIPLKTIFTYAIIINENNYQLHSPKVVLHMLAMLIASTVVGYSFLMKHVLNNVAKPSQR